MPTLNWIGKDAVVNHHLQVPFHLLRDVPELACGEPGSGNLIVQGDNLVALKALLPYYAGQVKCIYIDPPYNTGNEGWVYNDNVNSPVIREWLGKVVGKEGETLDRHDRWLCMMYPRLALLRQFLREDGAIFISIDDNEVQALRYLMDEIFGQHNFIATVIWQKVYTAKNSARHFSEITIISLYMRKRATFGGPISSREARNKTTLTRTPTMIHAGRGKRTPATGTQLLQPRDLFDHCAHQDESSMVLQRDVLALSRGKFLKLDASNANLVGQERERHSRTEAIPVRSEARRRAATMWFYDEVGHTQDAKNELEMLSSSDSEMFITPKPTRLIEAYPAIGTDPDSTWSWIRSLAPARPAMRS